MLLPVPSVRFLRDPKKPKYCFWADNGQKYARPLMTKKRPDVKGDYVLFCACDACKEVPLDRAYLRHLGK